MRSPTNSTAASRAAAESGFRHWNSPIPYLFGGIGVMLGLITVALVILACTNRKNSSSSSSSSRTPNSAPAAAVGVQEKPAAQVEVFVDPGEPKIVVIMAGDNKPTYLAKPVISNRDHDHDHDNHDEQAVTETSPS